VELDAALSGDGGRVAVPNAGELLEFGEAMLGEERDRQTLARETIYRRLGPAGLIDAAAIVASFNAVVKIADATGIPLEDDKAAATRDLREALGLERFNKNAASG